MNRSIAVLLLVVIIAEVSTAFRHVHRSKTTSVVHMANENVLPEIVTAVGAQPPLGYWDPVGFMKDCDMEQFEAVRERELKHGRCGDTKRIMCGN